VRNEVIGFGPIQNFLDDPTVSEIMINGPNSIFVERDGRITRSDAVFVDNGHVMRIIEKIIAPLGRRLDEASPMVDARLPDGSRVNAIIPPLSIIGPVVTIRKFSADPLAPEDLVAFGTLSEKMRIFLEACVKARLNILVSGGTGSGKTTTLNALSSFIPEDERIVTCEDAAELQLQQPHVVPLESRPPNIEGKGEITIRQLVKNCLRMRPDRIIVGECRGGEALDMLQAMNTGHDGSLTTLHANSPRDTLARLETLVLMAGTELPVKAIREQITSAIDLVVQQTRLRDGSRRISHITEVQRMEGESIVLEDIFRLERQGVGRDGRILAYHRPTGVRPLFMEQLAAEGQDLPADIFLPDS
jgi:pilus assembly protein CpaF